MNKLKFILEVFKISITSFGGPQGHLKQFLNVFSNRFKIINEEDIYELNNYCQLIPGASSTQLICLIAYRHGGLLLSFLTLLIWILPSSSFLCLLSITLQHYNILQGGSNYFSYLNPLVISYMTAMLITSRSYHIPNIKAFLFIITNTIIILLFYKHPFLIPILIILNGLIYHHLYKHQAQTITITQPKLSTSSKNLLSLFIVLLIILGFLSEFSRKYNLPNRHFFNLAEHNFRIGSTIYGGGDILIPIIYEQYVARPSSKLTQRRNPGVLQLQSSDVLTGAGIIRMMPGPLFSITAFTAPLLFREYPIYSQIFACVIAVISLFLPGYLISISLYEIWINYRYSFKYENFFKGINIVIYSLLVSTTIYLCQDLIKSTGHTVSNQFISLIEIGVLLYIQLNYKINNALLALSCILIGILQSFL